MCNKYGSPPKSVMACYVLVNDELSNTRITISDSLFHIEFSGTGKRFYFIYNFRVHKSTNKFSFHFINAQFMRVRIDCKLIVLLILNHIFIPAIDLSLPFLNIASPFSK
jgi:hypothetical protein